ncbi:serine/arginine-rich splicing factor SC35-like [Hibiscus syriacus]|uniref:serine/arginine-rich splicing factor SC35-like n=1 Tax=Hibiscus syriacus TaxID=106335 RepID=UPI0019212451|nr:serine/arginine-rich splicing factor SC35-like [Hibiscus syriacus]
MGVLSSILGVFASKLELLLGSSLGITCSSTSFPLMLSHQYDYYRDIDYKRRSRSRSYNRFERDRYHERNRDYRCRSTSRNASPGYSKGRAIGLSPRKSLSPRKASPRGESPERNFDGRSPSSRSVSPRGRLVDSRSPSPRNSDVDVSFTF